MRIPLFTLDNYSTTMSTHYENTTTDDRISFRDMLTLRQPSRLDQWKQVDARKISDFTIQNNLSQTCYIGNKSYTTEQALIASKLLMPTTHGSEYFFRNQGKGSHRGNDIILPRGTPIPSFTTGVVHRIKIRDGHSKDEGNCVVIKTGDNHYICYEHLDTIEVSLHQPVTITTIIGTCGNTGNSTQYHLHLQVDTHVAPFHPYRHADAIHMESYTIDPLIYLRNWSPHSPFNDMPLGGQEQEAILWLHQKGIVSGFGNKCFPENYLQRYEMALLINRVLEQQNLYTTLPASTISYKPYDDVNSTDPELEGALRKLQNHGVMKGHDGHFYPHQYLKGEELLALLGRIFFQLEDAQQGDWWQPYKDKFVDEFLILSNRGYIRQAIPRKEVFVLLWKLLV